MKHAETAATLLRMESFDSHNLLATYETDRSLRPVKHGARDDDSKAPDRAISHDQMVRAMQANDAQYDGRFYVGVHSTGIYCLPSCKARLPRLKNVKFYQTREEALAAGLRGCKRCRSDRFPDVLPEWVKHLIVFMRDSRTARITEPMLVTQAGVDMTTIRRHFKAHLGMTPLAFNRRQRLLFARQLIESGTNCLNAGFECGFESSSGFRSAFVRQFGKPPGEFYANR